MANNKSDLASGFMTWARPTTGVVNLKFVNNVFYKNRTAGPQANILTAQKGDVNAGLSGSLIFVNNTSIMNNTGVDGYNLADQTAVNISDFGGNFDVIFVNNVLLDCMTEPFTASGTTVEKLGWGWAIREAGAVSTGAYIIKNNLNDGIGGSANSNTSLQGFHYHFGVGAEVNNNKSYLGKSTEEKLSQAGISSVLSTFSGNIVPYIEINNNQGYVVDKGISSVLYKGEELIPQTDMRGVAISGTSKDLGAFELNSGISTDLENNNYLKSFAYINSDLDELLFIERVASVQIYTISGICVNTINNATSVNIKHLSKGVYILHITDEGGNLYSQKIRK